MVSDLDTATRSSESKRGGDLHSRGVIAIVDEFVFESPTLIVAYLASIALF